MKKMNEKRFRVALSFPSEKRDFVRQIADSLAATLGKERILYDEYLTAELARPNLDVYLGQLYHEDSDLLVPFFCADYQRKEWCGIEWRQMRDILKRRHDDQIMPFRFDDAPIPGVLSIDGYVKIGGHPPQEIAKLILQRVGGVLLRRDTPTPPVPALGERVPKSIFPKSLRRLMSLFSAQPLPLPGIANPLQGSIATVPTAAETISQPKVYLREKSPNEVAARINSLKPLERDLVAEQTYIGRWVRWSGAILDIRSSSSFLKGGAFTVSVGDHILGHARVSLEFLPAGRQVVESLQQDDLVSYEAKIIRAFSTEVYLTDVTFMRPEERSVADVTPKYLMRFFEGHTDIQASTRATDFIGKWMKVSGPLGNVTSFPQVSFADGSPVHMFFRKKKWVDQLLILSPGDNITAVGQITYVERGNLVLDNCELTETKGAS